MLLIMCIAMAIWPTHTECAISKPPKCPTWHYYSNNECVCGNNVKGAVICNANSSAVSLAEYFCIFFCDELNTTLVGSCPYSHGGKVPNNTSELKGFGGLCSQFHQRGQLCGACEKNYSLLVYSYNLRCIK